MQGTDAAEIGVFADGATGTAIVICAIDNLGKGAAGQAIQNANLALGLAETAGLRLERCAWFERHRREGLRRLGRRRRHPAARPQGPRDRALGRRPRSGAAMFTRNRCRPRACRSTASTSTLAEPQAVVINSGVANAATGERGKLDALATAAEAARLLDLTTEEVLVLSTGVIGAAAADAQAPARARPGRRRALADDGGADAAEAIMTTDTRSKEAVVSRGRLHGRRHGEGLRDDPSRPRDDARGRHDRLPARAGRGDRVPAAGGRDGFNAISVDGEPSTNDCVILLANGASGVERTATTTPRSRRALAEVCADLARQVVADGEGITVLAEINVTGAVDDEQAKAIARRIATSPLVKTALFGHDANWGRVLMAAGCAPFNGGYAAIDAEQVTLRYNGTVVLDNGTPTDVEPDVSGPSCTIELDLGLGDGKRRLPDERPLLRLRPHQRGLPHVSRSSSRSAARSRRSRRARCSRSPRRQRGLRRPRRRPADLARRWSAPGFPVEFVGGRR